VTVRLHQPVQSVVIELQEEPLLDRLTDQSDAGKIIERLKLPISAILLNFSSKDSCASSCRRFVLDSMIRSTACCGVSDSLAACNELFPSLFEAMPEQDNAQTLLIQGFAGAFEQMFDLQTVFRAIRLQRYGNRVLRGEHTSLLAADLNRSGVPNRLLNQWRGPGQNLNWKTLDQNRIARSLVALLP
jgi:hypothetical protein